ncbi:class F sortase [Yinghuangia sp. KLBMP8922]|uniref:Class F sortase n=2 Tax=Yinghuangia soli TaxID=2908204 RepID=A0AA41U4R3_9ACTN|nr:class F sortase [Yinghuangia soli]
MAVVAAAAVALGVLMVDNDLQNDGGPPQPAAAQSAAPAPRPATPAAPAASAPQTAEATPSVMKASPPLRIRIPRIKVDAPVTGLGLDASGVLTVPPAANRNLAGWYKDGVAPGARGAAIMLGHVDTKAGPAVFWGLGSLGKGDRIAVDRADGKTAAFEVDAVESFAKSDFPDERVYGPTPDAQLRLITCGGAYDRKKRDYLENVVVFAHLVPGG